MSSDSESPDELFARRCVERVLAVDLERWEMRGRPAAVDYHVNYPNRESAALEVTTLTDQGAREISSLSRRPLAVTPRLFSWDITPHPGVVMSELRQHVPRLIELCETAHVRDPFALPDDHDPALQWLVSNAAMVEVRGFPTTTTPTARLVRPVIGGAVSTSLTALGDAINQKSKEDLIAGKINKLDASGLQERQLFLLVDESGLPFDAYHAVAIDHEVPTRSPDVPESLTHLWLASGYYLGGVLLWSREAGWSRHWPFDNN